MSTDQALHPRQGLLGAWDRLVGPGMTTGETVLVLTTSVLGSVFAAALMWSHGAPLTLVGLAALIGFDVLGGAVCNGTRTTRTWYQRAGRTCRHHAGFIAPHLFYVVIVAAVLRGPAFDDAYAVIFGAGLIGSTAVILVTPVPMKTPVAFSAYLLVLCAIIAGAGPTPAMTWFEPALLLKLLLGHLLPEAATPGNAAQAAPGTPRNVPHRANRTPDLP